MPLRPIALPRMNFRLAIRKENMLSKLNWLHATYEPANVRAHHVVIERINLRRHLGSFHAIVIVGRTKDRNQKSRHGLSLPPPVELCDTGRSSTALKEAYLPYRTTIAPMDTLAVFVGLLVGLLLALQVGARWAKLRASLPETKGESTIVNSVFAMVAFFIAFSFSSAQSRLEVRTQLVIEEANAISTAYSRVDLCDTPSQAKLRPLYRDYVRSRIEGTDLLPDSAAARVPWSKAEQIG